jgi:bacterioferritin
MENETRSTDLLYLLNRALARELQVSVQYMMQHSIEAGKVSVTPGKARLTKQRKFVASHTMYFLPGPRLKKTAITEMQHAEAISERIVVLGGEPTTQPDPITIGATTREMLEDDLEQERGAIELYTRIIEVASNEHDEITAKLFRDILKDEERHHREFADLLAEG